MLISHTDYTVPIVIGNTDFHCSFLPRKTRKARKEYALLFENKRKTPNQLD